MVELIPMTEKEYQPYVEQSIKEYAEEHMRAGRWSTEEALRAQAGQQQAFVYDVAIFEAFRRHGYATQTFQLREERARELSATSIGLHVFGHNFAAREMYEKLGYLATNILMVKKLATEQ